MKQPIVFNWSGGKDSALALFTLLTDPIYTEKYEVVMLMTAANAKTKRSSLHGIPSDLLVEQAKCIGIELMIMYIPDNGDLSTYENTMLSTTQTLLAKGIKHFAFGDIHLESVKTYRETQLHPLGITVLEPLWGFTSENILQRFFTSGLQAIIMTANAELLDQNFIGKTLSPTVAASFPKTIDCCGENGEYHTFCFDGPIFKSAVPFKKHPVFLHEYHYTDLEDRPQISRYWQLPITI